MRNFGSGRTAWLEVFISTAVKVEEGNALHWDTSAGSFESQSSGEAKQKMEKCASEFW